MNPLKLPFLGKIIVVITIVMLLFMVGLSVLTFTNSDILRLLHLKKVYNTAGQSGCPNEPFKKLMLKNGDEATLFKCGESVKKIWLAVYKKDKQDTPPVLQQYPFAETTRIPVVNSNPYSFPFGGLQYNEVDADSDDVLEQDRFIPYKESTLIVSMKRNENESTRITYSLKEGEIFS